MGGHCQYQRRCAGDWSCAFGAVFCGRYGTHLRQLQRCEKTGTRRQTLYPICACKGGYHLRYGANACPVQYRAGYNRHNYDRRRLYFRTADNLAAGND